MVRRAFERFSSALIDAGEPSLHECLAASQGENAVLQELLGLTLHDVEIPASWFVLHDGGWVDAVKYDFFSLSDAIEHRRELSRDLNVPFVPSWMPIMLVSTESTVVDTATGKVLRYDLESGDQLATEAAPSLTAWIDELTVMVGGPGATDSAGTSFGSSVGRTWSGAITISSVAELENEARRALRGVAGLARRAADWIEGQEERLNDAQQRRSASAPEPTASPVPHKETGDMANTANPETTYPETANVGVVTQVVPSLRWEPRDGEIHSTVVLADARIVAAVTHVDRVGLYVLDPSQGLTSAFVADVPGPMQHNGLAASPVTNHVLVNGAFLCDIDAMAGRTVEALDGARLFASSTWSDDGSSVLISQGGAVQLYSLASGHVRSFDNKPSLVGNYLVSSISSESGPLLRIEPLDGSEIFEAGPDSHGFDAAGSIFLARNAFLSPDGTYLAANLSGVLGSVLIDLEHRTVESFTRLVAERFSADSSVLFAIVAGYPTSECTMIHLSDRRLDSFSDVQVEDAKFDLSVDGTRFVHHAVVPDHELGLEYIDWTRGTRSTLVMNGRSPYDYAVSLVLGDDCVIYYDKSASGDPCYHLAPIVDGQLGPGVDIGTGIAGRAPERSPLGDYLVWGTDLGVGWCHSDGTETRMFAETKCEWAFDSQNRLVLTSPRAVSIVVLH